MEIINSYCLLFVKTSVQRYYFKLLENGKVLDVFTGKESDFIKLWSFKDNMLYFYNFIGAGLYYNAKKTDEYRGEFCFFGNIDFEAIIVKRKMELSLFTTRYLNNNEIKEGILEVGPHSYGKVHFGDHDNSQKVIIGDYCSIANNVKIITRNHRHNLVTTYPFDELGKFYTNQVVEKPAHSTKNEGIIQIGNDVWIAENVTILPGVQIGDGAVIANGAVVTKNVPDYAIVGGVPAKIIKYRFTPEQIKKLKKIAWWSWDEEKVGENINKIINDDINGFIKEFDC